MNFKAAYQRFRRWQQNPFAYKLNDPSSYHCSNCGTDFVGNFCPICSQREGMGPITWKSVAQSIGEVWGLHNRSLLYSLVQLFLRPGYFISDYISGKRQVSFPPVKMLAVIAVLGVIVDLLTGAIHGMFQTGAGEKMSYITQVFAWLNAHLYGAFPPPSAYLSQILDWLNRHPDVLSLIMLSFLIIPNYFIFRFAPRNSHHTIPQGFFMQVFSTVVFLILNMLYDTTGLGWLVLLLGVVLIFMTYKQLFGYGVWGTLWRLVTAFVCAITLWSVLLNVNYGIHLLRMGQADVANTYFLNCPIAILIVVAILCLSYFISKRSDARHARRLKHAN
ncbi:MAG: DUF3667 domain-containing protein [Muribaculaceae bacterium]|nr:DUF3667 domain-containing protein [Muribaculaceae bacterium]